MSATASSAPRVAVVGAGPSGFYAAEALLRAGQDVKVDLFERLPVPHGLVRFGVAPDHPKLKSVTAVFERILMQPGLRYIGGVELGRDIDLSDLQRSYHAVVLSTGAPVDKVLGLPGEELGGVRRSAEVVGWYNGHPDHLHCPIDLSATSAVIIGQGNVALDMARVLLKPVEDLRHTDIAAHALEALAHSRIREVHVVGRRGPAKTRFSFKELQEFTQIDDCEALLDRSDFGPDSFRLPEQSELEQRLAIETLASFSAQPSTVKRRCVFHFYLAPVAIHGLSQVESVRFVRTPDWQGGAPGTLVDMPTHLVVSSIGRQAHALAGIPYDAERGTYAQHAGRVVYGAQPLPGLYVCGWAKRGAQGTIGTNRACSGDTVQTLLSDLPALRERGPLVDTPRLAALLQKRGRWFSVQDWHRIDAAERALGATFGKPREKFVRRDHMQSAAWESSAEI